MSAPGTEWPLWEVFIRGQHGLSHRHVGSLHAADAEAAGAAAEAHLQTSLRHRLQVLSE